MSIVIDLDGALKMADLLAYLQYQALALWLVLAAGWAWSGANRRRERLRRLAAHTSTTRQRPAPCGAARAAAQPEPAATAPVAAAATGGSSSRKGAEKGIAVAAATTVTATALGVSAATATPPPAGVTSNGTGSGTRDGYPGHTGNSHGLGSSGNSSGSGGGGDGDGGNAVGGVGGWLEGPPLPPVSVVMPVKGCRPHSIDNWESHLRVSYDGALQFLFVVESESDPAVPVLRDLMARHNPRHPIGPLGHEGGGLTARMATKEAGTGDAVYGAVEGTSMGFKERRVELVVAGLSSSCSQKAHNLCAGIEAADPRVGEQRGYVLCLDDDVALHPGSVRELVGEMEAASGVFMATGYPFDVPPPGSSFPAYLALSYHLPLLVAFSVAPDTAFVWGGCMMLRGRELLGGDPMGVLASWRDGGYSDDLILASLCTQQGLAIRVPPFAIFPQRLDPALSWRGWLNYLHRQLFVLDTYSNDHNCRTNHTMMLVHSVLSWALVLPSMAALIALLSTLLAALTALATGPLLLMLDEFPPPPPPLLSALAPLAPLGRMLLSTLRPHQSGSGWGQAVEEGSASELGVTEAGDGAGVMCVLCRVLASTPGGVVAVAVGWAAAHCALVFMTAEILALFRVLSPAAPDIPLHSYRWGRVWAALLTSNALLPLVMAYTYVWPEVEWGGVRYRKHRGRVVAVGRTATSSSTTTTATNNITTNMTTNMTTAATSAAATHP